MKALCFKAESTIDIIDVPIPVPKPGEVLIRCTHAGLCGSSMEVYRRGDNPERPKPGNTGHENVGVVEKSRCGILEGTHVLAMPAHYNGFAEYFTAEESVVVPLPDDIEDESLYIPAQPLATVLHALSRLPSPTGLRCAVVGLGPIGLLFADMLSRSGARQVIGIDKVAWRTEESRRYGVSDSIVGSDESVIEQVRGYADGALVDLCVEAAGTPGGLQMAARLVKRRGVFCPFGVQNAEMVEFPWRLANHMCLSIICSNGHGGFLDTAVRMVHRGLTAASSLAHPLLPFCDAQRAFAMYCAPEENPGALKVVLGLNKDS